MRDAIVTEARKYLGVPFRHQGRTELGLDCVGLLVIVARALGLPHYDTPNYLRRTEGSEFIERFQVAGVVAKGMNNMAPGDIIVMHEGGRACHVALVTTVDPPRIIHAFAARRRVVEELFDHNWRPKVVGCYTFPGVD